MTNLPSTSRYAVQDIPAISTVYFPVSSTFGLLMISLYTSFSVTILYFDPGNNSCKKMGHFFPLKTEMWALRFPQWCCWRYTSSGMACLGNWKVVPNMLRDCNVFVFWVEQSKNSGTLVHELLFWTAGTGTL